MVEIIPERANRVCCMIRLYDVPSTVPSTVPSSAPSTVPSSAPRAPGRGSDGYGEGLAAVAAVAANAQPELAIREARREASDELFSVLTPEQRAQLRDLLLAVDAGLSPGAG
jgi:hypothetical protein